MSHAAHPVAPDAGRDTRTRVYGHLTFHGSDESAPVGPPATRTITTPNGRRLTLEARGLVYAPCTRHGFLVIAAVDRHGDYGTRYRELPAYVSAEEQDQAEADLLAQLERDDPQP